MAEWITARSAQNAEPKDADDDQIDRDNEIQKPRHDENQHAGDESTMG